MQPKNTPQKREKDPWSCANSNPNKIPPPIPPPPWAKVQAQPLGRPALCPGGRGNGRGNSTRPTPSHTKKRHPRKLRKKKLHIIYLKGTHKKGGPKKKLQGCCFGTGGYCGVLLWESMLVQGVVLWVYCGHHFWYRGGTVGIMFGTGGVLWGSGGNHFW